MADETVADYACNTCPWRSTNTSRPLGRGLKVGCPDCKGEAHFVGTHHEAVQLKFSARREGLVPMVEGGDG